MRWAVPRVRCFENAIIFVVDSREEEEEDAEELTNIFKDANILSLHRRDGQTVYNLYRGVICVVREEMLVRIWVDMSHMEVCVAKLDSSFIARFPVQL